MIFRKLLYQLPGVYIKQSSVFSSKIHLFCYIHANRRDVSSFNLATLAKGPRRKVNLRGNFGWKCAEP